MNVKVTLFTLLFLVCFLCSPVSAQVKLPIQPGAYRTELYLPEIQNKNIAVIANQTSLIGTTHLVDSLLSLGIKIKKVFGPEHGFRGNAANGEEVSDTKDPKTGLPVVSLYGPRRKPSPQDLAGLDAIVFDLQDVGVRFYTHLTTLHFVMMSCAENNVKLIVLDRPNPNGYYVDGPSLLEAYKSDVGQHPIPLVHGMTLGELAGMINQENWIHTAQPCSLTVVPIKNWDHNTKYILPVPPSPNLPSQESIIAYPTMGLFEGLNISVGRGTSHPFECFGAPWLPRTAYSFVPKNIPGKAINPPFKGDTCYGYLISDFAKNYLQDYRKLYIEWIELLVQHYPGKEKIFNSFFDKLAGTDQLRLQLSGGMSLAEIRQSWQADIDKFKALRKPYLLYPCNEELGLRTN